MKLCKTIVEYKTWLAENPKNFSLGLVPTMGALHDGHISLIKKCQKTCDQTIVSIFLNPAQFNNLKDLERYPSNLSKDLLALESLKVNAVFVPRNKSMYRKEFATWVSENMISTTLEGKFRPKHFIGVATIVVKLFNIIQPTHVFFGEKDIQQLKIIQSLILDLNYNIQLVSCKTIRNKQGLALSSRNQSLSKKELNCASAIFRGLSLAKEQFKKGETSSRKLKKTILDSWEGEKELSVEYVEVVGFDSFLPIKHITQKSLICCAVFVGKVRLIDNIFLN